MQSIQNNLERSEFETKTRLGTQIRGLEREVAVLKQRLSSEEERRGKMMDAYEMQVYRQRERDGEDGAVLLIKPRIIARFNITGVLCLSVGCHNFLPPPTAEEARNDD